MRVQHRRKEMHSKKYFPAFEIKIVVPDLLPIFSEHNYVPCNVSTANLVPGQTRLAALHIL